MVTRQENESECADMWVHAYECRLLTECVYWRKGGGGGGGRLLLLTEREREREREYLLCYEEKRTDKVMAGWKTVGDEEHKNTRQPSTSDSYFNTCLSVYPLVYHVYPLPCTPIATVNHQHPFLPPQLQRACRQSKFKVMVTAAPCTAADGVLYLDIT